MDQLNAFLDACLAGRSKLPPDYLPPPIPDTQKTGNWLIDATNAALDYCLQDVSPYSGLHKLMHFFWLNKLALRC